ncbi:DUF2884 family protein [Alteromonas gilva]|uniref:DUF2884 family protein n=1 Tax=Alteromonas gilva TaxID=2987522 RepID=A0ABT5L192_9ALTE|nr:DUF2884 family protein [Alteromonas gilva]MDC8830166.1 DUF2884 family protein [Alteromonas gilva]
MCRILLLVLCVAGSAVSQPVAAHYSCDVDLNYGVVVEGERIRVLKDYFTVYQINHQQQLFVGGNWLKLDDQQARLVTDYATGLHAVIPQVTLLATTGIDLAAESVEQMFTSLLGNEHDSYEKLNAAMKHIKKMVRVKFRYKHTFYYLGPSYIEELEEFEDNELMAPLSKTLTTSVGSILTMLGAMDSDRFVVDEVEMATINERLAHYAATSDSIGPPALTTLPEKARWYCDFFVKLDGMEQQMKRAIPELAEIDLITLPQHQESN